MPSPTHGVVVPFRQSPLGSVIADDADAIQNPNNPMPNGNGAPLGAVDGTATDDSPLVPPLPPPRSEPEANLVVNWNGPSGCFSGYILDEHFPFV
ncbi:hypothetical protein FRC14_004010 [Serendipita sp. 396]|nr:hypothetical protein FRC14_004010 [Serendipita sp. 396]